MTFDSSIALYAAILSTFLGMWEFSKYRLKFYTSFFFTGDPNTNDVITLYNGSANSVVIHNIDLFRGKRRNVADRKPIDLGRYGELQVISIAPSGIYNINIPEEYKFKLKEGENLYLFVYVIGRRKAIKLKVCSN